MQATEKERALDFLVNDLCGGSAKRAASVCAEAGIFTENGEYPTWDAFQADYPENSVGEFRIAVQKAQGRIQRRTTDIRKDPAKFGPYIARVAEQNHGEVCSRCMGYGGHSSWPGWVCFDCGGRGWV